MKHNFAKEHFDQAKECIFCWFKIILDIMDVLAYIQTATNPYDRINYTQGQTTHSPTDFPYKHPEHQGLEYIFSVLLNQVLCTESCSY
jgi:hypothetical protein